MIKTNQVYKSFGDLQVLKGIDLDIKKGEIVSIVGTSGAGKTTLLQILGTISKADAGSIIINDQDITTISQKKISQFRNRNIGFVFQFHHLLPEFTALENVCIPAYIAKKSKSEAEKRAKEIFEFLKISERITHKPGELSGGEQQRVAIARALINQPAVILADEPSGNLDTKNTEELHKLFFSLRQDFNQTFIIVTHDVKLSNLSDRIIRLKDGIIID